MAVPAFRLDYVSAGCNRIVNALDWGEGGLIAYGSHNAVVIYDPQASRVVATALGHTGAVTCLRWFTAADFGAAASSSAPAALASGSVDGTVRIWWIDPHAPQQPWRLAASLEGHSAPVTSLALHSWGPPGGVMLVSTGGEGDVLVWHSHPASSAGLHLEKWDLMQRLRLGARLPQSAALAQLPAAPGCMVLALGGADTKVHLYLRDASCAGADSADSTSASFKPACELSGHQDWVRACAFTRAGSRLLLATASQDKYIRLWAVAAEGEHAATAAAAEPAAALPEQLTRYAPRPKFVAGLPPRDFSARLEALLIGHEDWVHSVAWAPAAHALDGAAPGQEPLSLLSASMDRTMTIWVPDEATGLWLSKESVGDAGANHLGYFTGVWGPGGGAIVAHGFTGALHMWRREEHRWQPQPAAGGHYGPVVDACWTGSGGGCLLTVGTDQTARLTAQLQSGRWCEIARPQVHGHDFSCVAALPPRSPPPADDAAAENGPGSAAPEQLYYASGSEEKVLRVFQAPQAFHDTLAMARGVAPARAAGSAAGAALAGGAYGATLPALGLSNKAVFSEHDAAEAAADGYDAGPDVAPTCSPGAVGGPPLEEHLAQNTLWPEVRKLYGHGNEVYCLAADPRGQFLASASRAQSAAVAGVWLWDARRWAPAGSVDAHTLTVTQLAFSPDGAYLASASRDRTVAVYRRRDQDQNGSAAGAGDPSAAPFELVKRFKAHARVVWSLDWSPDSALLATASRDGSVKVWAVGAGGEPGDALCTLPMGNSAQSVAFAPASMGSASTDPGDRAYLAAVGLESGVLCVLRLTWRQAEGEVAAREVWRSSEFEQHGAAVRRLCWRQAAREDGGKQELLLAACGDDHSVRIFACSL